MNKELKVLGLPCRQTMGAFLRFKRATGREATELTNSLSDMLQFIYCCTLSACSADGVDFPYNNVEEFADRISPDDLNSWVDAMQSDSVDHSDEEKKSHSAS